MATVPAIPHPLSPSPMATVPGIYSPAVPVPDGHRTSYTTPAVPVPYGHGPSYILLRCPGPRWPPYQLYYTRCPRPLWPRSQLYTPPLSRSPMATVPASTKYPEKKMYAAHPAHIDVAPLARLIQLRRQYPAAYIRPDTSCWDAAASSEAERERMLTQDPFILYHRGG